MSSKLSWITIPNTLKAIKTVPLACGVYRYWARDKIIYVGKSVTLKARLSSHLQNARFDQKEKAIVTSATHIDYTKTDNEFKALLLEAEQIQAYEPFYNRVLKDDKSYLYIVIDQAETYPKPRLLRKTEIKSKKEKGAKIKCFGPFPSSDIAESVLKNIRALIPFCTQSRVGKRACFYAHLGLCNPCPSRIEHIIDMSERIRLKKIYKKNLSQIIRILEGHLTPVINALTDDMVAASQQQNYELALKIRNKITHFEHIISTHSYSDKRILSYHTADAALTSLCKIIYRPARQQGEESPCKIARIECYDASHFAFKDSVVAMVVATKGEIDRKEYRRFRLKRPTNKSDFDQLEEALTRRLKHASWPYPDLIVIDGGTPQLRKLQPLLDLLPKPPLMVGLAKHPDHLIILRGTTYESLRLPLNDPGLNLLQTLRDEAHRFGNTYRKILNQKSARGET